MRPAATTDDTVTDSPTVLANRNTRRSKDRIRVSRACDHCKKKKIRCTGIQPCNHCTQEGIRCEFNAPYSRGKRRNRPRPNTPSLSPSSLVCLPPSPSRTVDPHQVPPQTLDEIQVNGPALSHNGPSARQPVGDVRIFSSQTSPEPGESDRQGYFVGASSGLSFLLRLQRRLRRNSERIAHTSVFTLGDPSLPEFNETAFFAPPPEHANSLLKTYFELSSPTYRFLHRPTVETWLQQLYDTGTILGPQSDSKYAVVMSVFAQATQYVSSADALGGDDGMLYFQAAERRLSRETEPATLTTVQALLGCCFYILTQSRLNHCWSLFGTCSRLILALGLHRKKTKFRGSYSVSTQRSCFIESECQKRVFWCAYNLDRYLSAIFGRPCTFHDDDIDQEMPALVEDQNLKTDSITVTGQENMNIMLGPLYHQKLGRILSSTLQRLYGIKPLDRATRYRAMAEQGAQVKAWRRELPAFLNPDKVDPRLLIPLFRRQNNLLSLACGHCLILIYRPCLFNDYSRLKTDKEIGANVQECLDAAMSIVTVIDHMVESSQFYAASWFSHYQAFCAVVVLYTFTIRSCLGDDSTWQEYFKAAQRCQGLISSLATARSLAQRFSEIMEEYRLEVLNQIQKNSSSIHPKATPIIYQQRQQDLVTDTEVLQEDSANMVPLATAMFQSDESSWLNNTTQNSNSPLEFMDLPNWEQLDSLALDLGDIIPDFNMMGQNDAFSH